MIKYIGIKKEHKTENKIKILKYENDNICKGIDFLFSKE
jgi:hypothetical protein